MGAVAFYAFAALAALLLPAATNGAQRAKVGNLSDMDPDDTVVYHQRNAKLGDLSDIAELTEQLERRRCGKPLRSQFFIVM